MKEKLKQKFVWIKNHYIISSIIFLVIISILYGIFGKGGNKQEVINVERGNINQKVMVTGKTKAVHSVDLGFEVNGKVSKSYVDVGTKVYSGQILVSLDQGESYANYLRAEANLASEEAKLEEMKKGTRQEDLDIAETQVSNAQTDLSDAKNNMSSKILDAYSKSDDVIHNNVDQFFSNPRTLPKFNLSVYDIQLKNNIEQDRMTMENLLSSWKIDTMDASDSSILKTKNNLSAIKSFLDEVANAVNSQTANANMSQTTVDGYKASISSARTTIINSISNISSAEEKLNSAKSALVLAQKNLDLKKAGNTPEAIKSEEARVMQYKADLQSANASLSKMTLYSPLNGVVTRQDAKVGEIITPGKSVVSVISDSDLEIEANVSEVNIGKVSIGNPVVITMDAFSGQTFNGTVSYIDPAETIVDGVVNYKVTISFSQKYPEMKSGLTTNLDIITSTKENVLKIPQYSITKNNSESVVMKKIKGKFIETQVQTGLVGQDGFVEIISGLSEGDQIETISQTK